MNLIDRQVATRNQLEQLEYDFKVGRINSEQLGDFAKIYLLKIKSEELILKSVQANALLPKSAGALIGRLDADNEMIECPDQDGKFITREMCLDYSGSHETCRTCENFGPTRKALLD